MKTKIISTLKKELLIIELPEGTDMKDPIQILKNKGNHLVYSKHNGHIISRNKLPDGEWTLLGKLDEIREEDAEELVEPFDFSYYVDYNHPSRGAYTITATESLLSALESEIYWNVNPIDIKGQTFSNEHENKWQQAQEKTFDKNRTLILVKN